MELPLFPIRGPPDPLLWKGAPHHHLPRDWLYVPSWTNHLPIHRVSAGLRSAGQAHWTVNLPPHPRPRTVWHTLVLSKYWPNRWMNGFHGQ